MADKMKEEKQEGTNLLVLNAEQLFDTFQYFLSFAFYVVCQLLK